ncbi:PEGA domain-containing protein [Terriglobus saanensis]|uniref:PEGA domain protein n=1 Tax=Terriglobus saanensis (strain ATCC BAA-1853 / DSM 23119 / SP1PR4) TaxID=401053 RepID=E8V0S1_TERSS|nr:PEGA domain-containing protein [Terriglobus saanensis]ADV81134.1 PEGA domain protein [Terriglobus saanensis SP1PR4]
MQTCIALSLIGTLIFANPASAQQTAVPAAPAAASVAPEPSRVPLPNTLMDGTAVKLRLVDTVSSADAHVGQQVPFEVTEDVVVQGITIAPKGSQALATVTTAEPKKRMGRGGKLDVNVDSMRLTDGEKVQLRAVKDTKGGGHVGAMTGAMVATSIVFFPAAPLFLFMHGKDITIPKGTDITAFVQGDMKLNLASFTPATPGSPSVDGIQSATLVVDSSSPGADIEVDGNFMGNTPSSLSVAQGQHTITVKKKGYQDWSKSMNLSGSSVHLNAELEVSK